MIIIHHNCLQSTCFDNNINGHLHVLNFMSLFFIILHVLFLFILINFVTDLL